MHDKSQKPRLLSTDSRHNKQENSVFAFIKFGQSSCLNCVAAALEVSITRRLGIYGMFLLLGLCVCLLNMDD